MIFPKPSCLAVALLAFAAKGAAAQEKPAPKPAPDTLVFRNGEQLSGSLEKADAKGITFKSPVAGVLTVKWADIRQLRTEQSFAVLTTGEKITPGDAESVVPKGDITVEDKQIHVATQAGQVTVPLADTDLLVDSAAFNKAVDRRQSLLEGWGGTASSGVSLVRATQNSTTFNGAIALVRVAPEVAWLPARSRSTVDYTQSYGTVSQVGSPTVKTNIFHADAERDQYFKPRGYYFASATFDHNFSESLSLQQAYGAGIGTTLLRTANRTLDFKGDLHYERQSFLPANGVIETQPGLNLIGATLTENYLSHFGKGLVFTENGSFSPALYQSSSTEAGLQPEPSAYSAHFNASLGLPVHKGLGLSLGAVDDYLNNAPVGSKKNSVQLTTNLTYTFKPK